MIPTADNVRRLQDENYSRLLENDLYKKNPSTRLYATSATPRLPRTGDKGRVGTNDIGRARNGLRPSVL